jgi:hypothetical protein
LGQTDLETVEHKRGTRAKGQFSENSKTRREKIGQSRKHINTIYFIIVY